MQYARLSCLNARKLNLRKRMRCRERPKLLYYLRIADFVESINWIEISVCASLNNGITRVHTDRKPQTTNSVFLWVGEGVARWIAS